MAAVPVLFGAPETEPSPFDVGSDVDDKLMTDLLSPGLTASAGGSAGIILTSRAAASRR
jgi:hypothetical protein